MRNLAAIIILASLFLIINLPKNQFVIDGNETIECSCVGFIGERAEEHKICYGITHGCRVLPKEDYIKIKFSDPDFCKNVTCQSTREYLGIAKPEQVIEAKEVKKKGVNMLLILDISFSMLGPNIANTKAAAIKLVEELLPDDYCAIIVFNNNAKKIHDFSTDKESLIKAINDIKIAEDTRYTPALTLAQQTFAELGNNNKRDFIIFMSDGYPMDTNSEIINATEVLKGKGIEIYTVRVLEEKGARKDDILGEMASPLGDSGTKGFFVHEYGGESIYDSFKTIYNAVVEKDYYFSVIDNYNRTRYLSSEPQYFDFNLLSSSSEKLIPGYMMDDGDINCIKNADISAVVSNRAGYRKEVPLRYSSGSYVGESEGIPEGLYSVYLNISLDAGPDCRFEDMQFLRTISVEPQEIERGCEQASCIDIQKAVRNPNIFNSNNYKVNTFRRKKLLISLDSSESMRYDSIESSKPAIEYLFSLFTKNFDIALIEFNTDARLVQPFTYDIDLLKAKLSQINVRGTTRYSPVFEKANYIFEGQSTNENYMLFISDGLSWDESGKEELMEDVDNLLDKGVCIYTVDYSFSKEPANLLKDISKKSIEKNSCGGYSQVSLSELREYFMELYNEVRVGKGDLDINIQVSKETVKVGEPLMVKAKVYSEYNSHELPSSLETEESMIAVGSEDFCFPVPEMNITIFDGQKLVHQGKMIYDDMHGFGYVITILDEGIYDVRLNAAVISDESCRIYGEKSISLEVKDDKGEILRGNAAVLIIIDILLLLLIAYYLITGL